MKEKQFHPLVLQFTGGFFHKTNSIHSSCPPSARGSLHPVGLAALFCDLICTNPEQSKCFGNFLANFPKTIFGSLLAALSLVQGPCHWRSTQTPIPVRVNMCDLKVSCPYILWISIASSNKNDFEESKGVEEQSVISLKAMFDIPRDIWQIPKFRSWKLYSKTGSWAGRGFHNKGFWKIIKLR